MTRGIRNTRPAILDFQINLKSAVNLGVRKHLFPQGPWNARGQTEDQAAGQLHATTLFGSRTAQNYRGRAPGLGLENSNLVDPSMKGLKSKMTGPISTGAVYALAKTMTGAIGILKPIFGEGATRTGQASALEKYLSPNPGSSTDAEAIKFKKEIRDLQNPEDRRLNDQRARRVNQAQQDLPASPHSRLLSANERSATALENLVNIMRQPGGLPAGAGD